MIMTSTLCESQRDVSDAVYDFVMESGAGWMYELKAGQVLRMVDVEGNQAVDTIFYATNDIEAIPPPIPSSARARCT